MATTRKSIITLVHRQLSSCRLRPHRLRSHQLRSHRLRPRRLWAHRLCLISCALSTLIAQIVHILYEHSACLSHLNSTIITTTRVFYTLVCAEVSNPLHISLRPRLSSSLPSPSLTLFSPSPPPLPPLPFFFFFFFFVFFFFYFFFSFFTFFFSFFFFFFLFPLPSLPLTLPLVSPSLTLLFPTPHSLSLIPNWFSILVPSQTYFSLTSSIVPKLGQP